MIIRVVAVATSDNPSLRVVKTHCRISLAFVFAAKDPKVTRKGPLPHYMPEIYVADFRRYVFLSSRCFAFTRDRDLFQRFHIIDSHIV